MGDLNGAVDEHALSALVLRTSRRAFEHVRSSLHRGLDMARELIAAGCPELASSVPALEFSLVVRHEVGLLMTPLMTAPLQHI